jgi:tRNA(Arg) A34 adenosine deaminase TadA
MRRLSGERYLPLRERTAPGRHLVSGHDLCIALPDWVDEVVDWDGTYGTDDARMRLAISLASENVQRGTGGPFGAAIVEEESGRLLSVGMNRVVPQNNSILHAEMIAFMMAQRRVGSYTLGARDLPAHTLVSSCDPCAMCLGAALWSGVRRVVCGATRDDAEGVRFDEGPVFPESYRYLADKGIAIVHGVLRDEARAVLERYASSGEIYNG